MRVTVEYLRPGPRGRGSRDARLSSATLPATRRNSWSGSLAIAAAGWRVCCSRDDRLSPVLLVSVNDQQATAEPVPLRDGDVVSIIPPVSGGSR